MIGHFGETFTALSASNRRATELPPCQAKSQRSHAADSSNLSQLGMTENSREGRVRPSKRIALDVPIALAMLRPSEPQLRL